MDCPQGWKAINGYFYATKPGLALGSSFSGKNNKVSSSKNVRTWYFMMLNFNSSITAKYYTGVVCVKGLAGCVKGLAG